jgi:hypothetical protein
LDIDYMHKICDQAFPPGEHYKMPPLPNITAVNAIGDYHIAADRLAFIDGQGMFRASFNNLWYISDDAECGWVRS